MCKTRKTIPSSSPMSDGVMMYNVFYDIVMCIARDSVHIIYVSFESADRSRTDQRRFRTRIGPKSCSQQSAYIHPRMVHVRMLRVHVFRYERYVI